MFHFIQLKPNGKAPAGGQGWLDRATTTPPKSGNVGIMGGDGLLVVDVDIKKGKPGIASYERLKSVFGLPDTALVKTQSGGYHHYFSIPKELGTSNSLNLLQDLGYPGLDLIGEKRFVVAPPSKIDGIPYQWLTPPEAFETLPSVSPSFEAIIRLGCGREKKKGVIHPLHVRDECAVNKVTSLDYSEWTNGDLFEKFRPGKNQHYAKMVQFVGSLFGRGLTEVEVRKTMEDWHKCFANCFSDVEQALGELDHTIVSTIRKIEAGKFKVGANHEEVVSDWELTQHQTEWLGRLKVTEREREFVEALLIHVLYERKRGRDLIPMTKNQIKKLLFNRFNLDWDNTLYYYYVKKFITTENCMATKLELLARTLKGERSNEFPTGRPSEYRLTGFLKALGV